METAQTADMTRHWVGYPHRPGNQQTLNVKFNDDDAGPGGLTSRVALWQYSPGAGTAGPQKRPRILLIHGFRGDHHGMQLIVDALPEFEVFVPDLPGFGTTSPLVDAQGSRVEHTVARYAGFVGALAQQLDLNEHDVLMGHSFGTIVTAAHTAQNPQAWAKLVLTAPISNHIFRGRLLAGAAVVELYYAISRLLPESAGNAFLRSRTVLKITNLTMRAERDPRVTEYVRDQHAQHFGGYSDRQTLLEAYAASSRHTVLDYAADLRLPVLLLPGSGDQLSTEAGRRALRDALPQGKLEVIRGAGHLVHYEKPAQIARAIRRWVS